MTSSEPSKGPDSAETRAGRSRSSSSSPPPWRRPVLAAVGLAVLALAVTIAALWPEGSPRPKPVPRAATEPAPTALPPLPPEAGEAEALLARSRAALKKGRLMAVDDLQGQAEGLAERLVAKYPGDPRLAELRRRAGDIVFQFERHGGAEPDASGRTEEATGRYPEEAGPGQVNDLFLTGWAEQRRNRVDQARAAFEQALTLLDGRTDGQGPAESGRGAVAVPPQPGNPHYLLKYYAVSRRLAALEDRAGREDRAEAVRRQTLAALDRGLTAGLDPALIYQPLGALLRDLARSEIFSGRLESARGTVQRRLGLMQLILRRSQNDPALMAAVNQEAESWPNKIMLELAWLDRNLFQYDEGLEYLAEMLDAAERRGPAAFTDDHRRALLLQGVMMMDLGRFEAAELALQKALPRASRQQDEAVPAKAEEADVEPRVTTIRANLALAELRLALGDPAEANRFMEEAVSLYRTLPDGHPVTFDVQLIRVKVLARQGDSQRAERELTGFLAGAPEMLASPAVDIWVKRQILALMAEAAWQAGIRGEVELAAGHYRRVNDELTPYITGIDVDKASEYGSLFRPILVEIMEGEGDLWAEQGDSSRAEGRYVLGLDMARTLSNQEPRQYFWRTRFNSLAGKVERFHLY